MHEKRLNPSLLVDLLLSCTMSVIWVRSYGYTYNIDFFNSAPVNWFACLLWTGGLAATLLVHRFVHRRLNNFWISFPLTWLAYFSGLLVIEYLGYYVLAIRQVTAEEPLLLGLIHGTVTLKAYYMAAGIGVVVLRNSLPRVGELVAPRRAFFRGYETVGCYDYDSGQELNKAL